MACLNPIDLLCNLTGWCKTGDQAQESRDTSPAYAGRVRILEGMTPSQLKQLLRGYAPSSQDLKELENIFRLDTEGNPDRIDAGPEAIRLAEKLRQMSRTTWNGDGPLFFRIRNQDIKAYLAQENLSSWENRISAAQQETGIAEVQHPFATFIRALPIRHIQNFRSLGTFDSLAKTVSGALPNLKSTRHLQVLYPGSGAHLAPLITAFRMIDQATIDQATFVYTEIKEEALKYLSMYLSWMVKEGIADAFNVSAPTLFETEIESGKEFHLNLVYGGKPVHILFALNRSGESYYREEYLHNADLVIIHDPGNNSLQQSYALLSQMLFEKSRTGDEAARARPQLVVLEGDKYPKYFLYSLMRRITLPENVTPVIFAGPYGHCDGIEGLGEIKECEFETAHVLPLHDPTLLREAKQASSPEDLRNQLYEEIHTGIGRLPPYPDD